MRILLGCALVLALAGTQASAAPRRDGTTTRSTKTTTMATTTAGSNIITKAGTKTATGISTTTTSDPATTTRMGVTRVAEERSWPYRWTTPLAG